MLGAEPLSGPALEQHHVVAEVSPLAAVAGVHEGRGRRLRGPAPAAQLMSTPIGPQRRWKSDRFETCRPPHLFVLASRIAFPRGVVPNIEGCEGRWNIEPARCVSEPAIQSGMAAKSSRSPFFRERLWTMNERLRSAQSWVAIVPG